MVIKIELQLILSNIRREATLNLMNLPPDSANIEFFQNVNLW